MLTQTNVQRSSKSRLLGCTKYTYYLCVFRKQASIDRCVCVRIRVVMCAYICMLASYNSHSPEDKYAWQCSLIPLNLL